MSKKYYYDISDDLLKYPDCWIYVIVGGRNTGKTYSALRYMIDHKKKFVFIKRTIDDVKLICAGSGKLGSKLSEYGLDLSPFKSLNRDFNWNIKPFNIKDGIGGFWNCDDENQPIGEPIGYILALSAVNKFKGFDLSECDYIIFDEFIPRKIDRASPQEGDMLLDLYKTIDRDRLHRNREPLVILALANATDLSNPLCNTLEITDDLAEMSAAGIEYYYDSDRLILVHNIIMGNEFTDVEKNSPIYKAMNNTNWGRMAFDNEFAYNDMTAVNRQSLKKFRPYIQLIYKNAIYYIYIKEGLYYMCSSANQCILSYNLNTENDQKNFYNQKYFELRTAMIEGRMTFEKYTMYDIIANYTKFFKIR